MAVPLHIFGWLCGWNFSGWDFECNAIYYRGLPSQEMARLGADAGVWAVGALGKSQEKQVEQLTAGSSKMVLGLPAWA